MDQESEGLEMSTDQPVAADKSTDQPVSNDKNTDQPVADDKSTDQPVSNDKNTDQSVADENQQKSTCISFVHWVNSFPGRAYVLKLLLPLVHGSFIKYKR